MIIRQIIFDMGNVLLNFDMHALAAAFTENQEAAHRLYQGLFNCPDWHAMDRGILSEEGALSSIQSRLPAHLRDAARQVMERWDEWLVPNEEVNALARELDGLGFPLYLLSNTSQRFARFRERIPVWPLLKGALLSFEEKLMKPDPEIYRRLFARFHLSPGECFFIDDSSMNIEAAQWCGMQGCHYQGDILRLRAALRAAGVPVAP